MTTRLVAAKEVDDYKFGSPAFIRLWGAAACAAIASGKDAEESADIADDLMIEWAERFAK